MKTLSVAALATTALFGTSLFAADVQPTNDLPNPYRTTAPWGKVTDRTWGALNGVAIDNDGTSLWVIDRCGANPDVPPGVSPEDGPTQCRIWHFGGSFRSGCTVSECSCESKRGERDEET